MPCHASHIDPLITLNLLGTPTSFIAKNELFKIPILGYIMRHGRTIPIDRKNLTSAIESLKIAQNYAKNGNSIVIAPEGTRRRKRSFEDASNILEFKKGPFHLAKNTGLKIVPIVYVGANRLLPPGKLCIQKGNIYVKICEPILPEKVKELNLDELMELVRNTMIKNSYPRKDDQIFRNNRRTAFWILSFWVGTMIFVKFLKSMFV